MAIFNCSDCVMSGTDACRFGANYRDYSDYCDDMLVEQDHAYKLGFSEAINKSIETIKKRQKYLRENYALDVTAIAECEAIKILLQQLEK